MQPETEGVPSKKMEGLQIDGYLPTAKANLELTGALDRIKVPQSTCCRRGACCNQKAKGVLKREVQRRQDMVPSGSPTGGCQDIQSCYFLCFSVHKIQQTRNNLIQTYPKQASTLFS